MRQIITSLILLSAIPAMAATVLQYNFEDGTAGQPMTTTESGGAIGSQDISGNGRDFQVWGATYGPTFSAAGDTPTGVGLSSVHVADKSSWPGSGHDGYTTAINTWAPKTWTIECAIKISNLNGWTTFIGRDGSTGVDTNAALYFQKVGDTAIGNKFRINFMTVSGDRYILDSDVVAEANKWYRVAATSNGSALSIYVNKLDGTGWTVNTLAMSTTNDNSLRATGNMTFGRGWWNGNFVDHLAGNLDDIRISDIALTPAQFIKGEFATAPNPTSTATVPTTLSQLSWLNPANVGKCDVWFGPGDANELNYKSRLTKYTITTPTQAPTRQTFAVPMPLVDGKYTWVVDCYKGSPLPAEPNLPGLLWHFTAASSPIFTTHPANQSVFVSQTAVFSVVATSNTPVSYAWFKSVDNVNNTAADDTQVGENSPTLTLTGVAAADERYYYCNATNNGGSTLSNVAKLVVKRQVAHWTLDSKTGGIYADSGLEGHNATIIGDPNIVLGVNPAKTNNAAEIAATAGMANAGTWNPSQMSGQFTVSCWVKWNGAAANQIILSKANDWQNPGVMWSLACGTGGNIFLMGGAGGTGLPNGTLKVGQWQFIAVTFDGTNATIYSTDANGTAAAFAAGSGAFTLGQGIGSTVWIGSRGSDATTPAEPFTGVIDEVQIFNYAKDAQSVADLYNEVLVRNFCFTFPGVSVDFNQDCKVNLYDFAEMAKDWLRCGLYPNCP